MMTYHPWVRQLRANPSAQARLFCFPYAGGGVSIFHQWADSLLPGIELLAIRLPGRESQLTETPFTSLPALIPLLAEALRPYLDQPFAFLGHSMGALVAFELAHHLAEQGFAPHILFVSAHRAPHLPQRNPLLHTLKDQAFMNEVIAFGGTPADLLAHPELMRLIVPTLRADFTLCETYVFDHSNRRLTCPVFAFGGHNDVFVNKSEIMAWDMHTHNVFGFKMFDGNHFFINTHTKDIISVINKHMNRLLTLSS